MIKPCINYNKTLHKLQYNLPYTTIQLYINYNTTFHIQQYNLTYTIIKPCKLYITTLHKLQYNLTYTTIHPYIHSLQSNHFLTLKVLTSVGVLVVAGGWGEGITTPKM